MCPSGTQGGRPPYQVHAPPFSSNPWAVLHSAVPWASFVVRGCDMCGALVAFSLLHSVLQGQICLLFQVFLFPGGAEGTQKSPDTPGSPEGNTEGPGTASSEPLLPS